jgi:hypothetical protein
VTEAFDALDKPAEAVLKAAAAAQKPWLGRNDRKTPTLSGKQPRHEDSPQRAAERNC